MGVKASGTVFRPELLLIKWPGGRTLLFLAMLETWLWGRQCRSVHHLGPDWNISTTVTLIGMKLGADTYVPPRINCNNFSFSTIIRLKFQFVQYFGLWLNTCKTNIISIHLISLSFPPTVQNLNIFTLQWYKTGKSSKSSHLKSWDQQNDSPIYTTPPLV